MTTSVVRALRHSGGRKAGTPLEMASTPVTAAPPEAKACSTTNRAAPMKSPSPAEPKWSEPDLVDGLRRQAAEDHSEQPDAEQQRACSP